jgi:hypothetical protein
MDSKNEQPEVKFSISKVNYHEYKNVDSQLIIECDYITAGMIINYIGELKVANENSNR